MIPKRGMENFSIPLFVVKENHAIVAWLGKA